MLRSQLLHLLSFISSCPLIGTSRGGAVGTSDSEAREVQLNAFGVALGTGDFVNVFGPELVDVSSADAVNYLRAGPQSLFMSQSTLHAVSIENHTGNSSKSDRILVNATAAGHTNVVSSPQSRLRAAQLDNQTTTERPSHMVVSEEDDKAVDMNGALRKENISSMPKSSLATMEQHIAEQPQHPGEGESSHGRPLPSSTHRQKWHTSPRGIVCITALVMLATVLLGCLFRFFLLFWNRGSQRPRKAMKPFSPSPSPETMSEASGNESRSSRKPFRALCLRPKEFSVSDSSGVSSWNEDGQDSDAAQAALRSKLTAHCS